MRILLTGGTGSFGHAFVEAMGREHTIRILSRSELLQAQMLERFGDEDGWDLRFLIGDVRDRERLARAARGVDAIVHAAAMKRIEICERDPFEAVQTNVNGAQNVVDAAYRWDIERVVALSTDKAVHPINLYGATKLCAEKIVRGAGFSVVRYGNVMGSRGSVVHAFRSQSLSGELRLTDPRMTRFWMTLDHAVSLVTEALGAGGPEKLVVPRVPSMRVVDLAAAMYPELPVRVVGIRQGEKLHETLLTAEESTDGRPYTSDVNTFYSVAELAELVGESSTDHPPLGSHSLEVA
jgi:FlaA1/EpsC-like NDP-sugar epimerase